ncbi:MAG: DNA polymerase III subunit beta [Patescibacteria group bacterium]
MKASTLQENLNKALSLAARFISPRAQLPVLGNILLRGKKNKLLISSTNLEVSVSSFIGAKIEKEGEITIPGRVITEIVSNLPQETLDLEVEKEQLKIKASNFESSLSGMNASDFPSVPDSIKKEGAIVLPKATFLDALSQVIFATSVDETRPILTGVLFVFEKDLLTLVATDGFRLSQKKLQIKSKEKDERLVLPRGVLGELSRFSEEDEFLLSVNKKENQVLFGAEDTVISSRTLQGDFPAYEKIIPKERTTKVYLDKEDFLRAVKLASVFAKESANIVKVTTGKGRIEIVAESSTSGTQKTKVEAKIEGNEEMEISFNYRFLEEFLHATKGEEVNIGLSGPSSPGVFTDPSDLNFLHLIMPVRIQA